MHFARYAMSAGAALVVALSAYAESSDECTRNSHCDSKCCGTSYDPNICIEKKVLYPTEPCSTKKGCDCFKRKCRNGFCAGCKKNKHCPGTSVCCEDGSCAINQGLCGAQCDDDDSCHGDLLCCPDGSCLRDLQLCDGCVHDNHCAGDMTCCRGSCIAPPNLCDTGCQDHNECVVGGFFFCCPDGTCADGPDSCESETGCRIQLDCEEGFQCCPGGVCVPTEMADCVCDGNDTCTSGTERFCCWDGGCADELKFCACRDDSDCVEEGAFCCPTGACSFDGSCARHSWPPCGDTVGFRIMHRRQKLQNEECPRLL